jgi:hypothetical protein
MFGKKLIFRDKLVRVRTSSVDFLLTASVETLYTTLVNLKEYYDYNNYNQRQSS